VAVIAAQSTSAWAPLRVAAFRALWIAVLVSNVGSWMQTVGAQWLVVGLPNAAVLVALVQAADDLPDTLFSLIGGALSDTLDRRKLLIALQVLLVVFGTALTLLTLAGQMPPYLLLFFTFLIGFGTVIGLPAYQSLIPDIVPRSEIRAASALSSVNVNVAHVIGPAIGGVVIARIGVPAVFALNTLSFAFFLLVVLFWHEPPRMRGAVPEPFVSAVRAGARYVRYSPVVRRILLRAAIFLLPASALWALLPLVATQRLRQGADGYGLLLGALGVGAVAGVLLLPRLRRRMTTNRLLMFASLVYAAGLVTVVSIPLAAVALVVLLPIGAAWVAVLSDINAALQLYLPAWVRARGLSIYQMVLFGSQVVGSVIWGLLALPAGVVLTILIAAALVYAGVATTWLRPFPETDGMDRGVVTPWPEPQLAIHVDHADAPVVVQTTYMIAPEREHQFLQAMAHLRSDRLRTGATLWGLLRDGVVPRRFVELFVVPSWDEHVRQHRERLTRVEQTDEELVTSLSDPAPVTDHLVAAELVTPRPEPLLAIDFDHTDVPVVVQTTYMIAPEREHQFLQAMANLRSDRLRTGATWWELFRDGVVRQRFVELFVVPSWDEPMRQHRERLTRVGQTDEELVNSLSDPEPVTEHLLAAEPQA
jgi:predicted MFS family arabinose efflux permease